MCRASLFYIRALRQIRLPLTEEIANVVACALVQSRVDYANSMYTGMSSINFDKLQLVKNILACVVTHQETGPHPAIAQETALATDRSTCRFQDWTLTYSIRYSGEPQHLNSLLMDYKLTRSLRSAEEHLFVVPRTKSSSTSRAFSVAAPKRWNNLS